MATDYLSRIPTTVLFASLNWPNARLWTSTAANSPASIQYAFPLASRPESWLTLPIEFFWSIRAIIESMNTGHQQRPITPGRAETRSYAGSIGREVTRTSTFIARKSPGPPVQLPAMGIAWVGSRTTATRIRSRLPTMPLVGSNSIQPEPGR